MTTPADTHSDAGSASLAGTPRVRVDLIGLGALVIAGLGLAVIILMTRAPALESTTAPGVPAAVAAPPARDQWYLDRSNQAPEAPELSAATTATTAAQIGASPARDYLHSDAVQIATALPIWSQTRDRWYLDGRVATDAAKDRWYADRP